MEVNPKDKSVEGRVGGMGPEKGLVYAGIGPFRNPGERAAGDAAQRRAPQEGVVLHRAPIQFRRQCENEGRARLSGRSQGVRGKHWRNPWTACGFKRRWRRNASVSRYAQ